MNTPKWNWQLANWPRFTYDPHLLETLERSFLEQSGHLAGSVRHIGADDHDNLLVELLSDEAQKTSKIEGELLNRDSLQSSIQKHLGFQADAQRRVSPAEAGIAEMMVHLHKHSARPLDRETLFAWHAMLCRGRRDLKIVGGYRADPEPMQIVSKRLDRPRIYFEAPPAERMDKEMDAFLAWFNATAPEQKNALQPLSRAGVAHFYFLCVHPFEDGNGRIARALSEKAASQSLGKACPLRLSHVIEAKKKEYYAELGRHNHRLDITPWLLYFAETLLAAQRQSQQLVDFIISKTKYFLRFDATLNERQRKVIKRMFAAGPDDFAGGFSAGNYRVIAKTSKATATRDLQDLLAKGALTKTGVRKGTRYQLPI